MSGEGVQVSAVSPFLFPPYPFNMSLLEVYTSLPKPNKDLLHVPYYTESLSTFTGVRVFPSEGYLEGLPPDLVRSASLVGFPCFVVPIHSSGRCYGLVLKGRGKPTPRYGNTARLCGWESIAPGSTVVLVEGFKDAYILRRMGVVALPLLTSMPSARTLSLLSSLSCKVVYVPDNDSYGQRNAETYITKASSARIKPLVFRLSGVSDLGDVFDPRLKRAAISEASRLVSTFGIPCSI